MLSVRRLCMTVTVYLLVSSGPASAQDTLRIRRDTFGIPTITAPTDAGAAFGLAFAHAEDDFPTLQIAYASVKGLAGRTRGIPGAAADYAFRFFGIDTLVARRYDTDLSESFRAVAEGYAAGLNAYARLHPEEVIHESLFPIHGQHVVAYSVLQLTVLAGGDRAIRQMRTGRETPPGPANGSNGMAVRRSRTGDGTTVLLINPHQPFEGLISWYEAGLATGEGWGLHGALLPGSPLPLLGANRHLAWTLTVNDPDLIDLYRLQSVGRRRGRYRVDDTLHRLQKEKVKLKIRVLGLTLPFCKTVWRSLYGPTLRRKGIYYSMRTPTLHNIRALEQWYLMGKSRNFTEFRQALQLRAIPAYNMLYADESDTIHYIANAAIPLRHPGYDWKGMLPGNTRQTLWTRLYPLDSLPQLTNPPDGVLYNTNHTVTRPAPDTLLPPPPRTGGFGSDENNRSLRLRAMLRRRKTLDREAVLQIKWDVQYPDTLRFERELTPLFRLQASRYPKLEPVIRLLQGWDRQAHLHSTGATVMGVLLYRMTEGRAFLPKYRDLDTRETVGLYRYARRYLLRHFGSVEVPLGQYQRLVRGNRHAGVPGLPDMLADIESGPWKEGRIRALRGDSFIGLVRFGPSGTRMETISTYGASHRPLSPHYNDQMPLFLQRRLKTVIIPTP